ncbi:hypothetical protein CDAR_255081 [Caerostris darwini]|uniref:Uncharacterized protein n=1 Tax=Caerostris darwini TaxID=1538125 RepID=A0AAV4VAU9_9ARAC|nr:hypothetical protein CDAR_255081 [Caerostris darwini]
MIRVGGCPNGHQVQTRHLCFCNQASLVNLGHSSCACWETDYGTEVLAPERLPSSGAETLLLEVFNLCCMEMSNQGGACVPLDKPNWVTPRLGKIFFLGHGYRILPEGARERESREGRKTSFYIIILITSDSVNLIAE